MMTESDGHLEFRRPFHWGIVVIGDRETTDIPEIGPEDLIASNSHAVVVPVRHAQDVEVSRGLDEVVPFFDVTVRCSPGVAQGEELRFDGVVSLPSGVLWIGDADDEALVPLAPGLCRLQVAVEPRDHPESVRVWYSSAQ